MVDYLSDSAAILSLENPRRRAKRLRKLTAAGFLYRVQRNQMEEAVFRLGASGKRTLENLGADGIVLERRPPVQREHFRAINDLRIAAELSGIQKYFYAAWELPGIGWKDSIIPDGIVALGEKRFALEFDSGSEGVQFFVRSKMGAYERGLSTLPVTTVVIVTASPARVHSLANVLRLQNCKVLLTTIDLIQGHGFLAPIFYSQAGGWGATLFESVSCQDLSATREAFAVKCSGDNQIAT